MSERTPPWFPTDGERAQTHALLGVLERHERLLRRVQAAQARVSAQLMRIAVAQSGRASTTALSHPEVARRGPVDEMPVRSLVAEVALVRGVTRFRARRELSDAYLLHEMFPATRASVERGELAPEAARAVTDHGFRLSDDDVRGSYEEHALRNWEETPAQSVHGFRGECARIAQTLCAQDERTRARAERARRAVFTTPVSDHLAELHVIGEATAIHGMENRITAIATTVLRENSRAHREATEAASETAPGIDPDPRDLGEVCADVAADLVLTGTPTAHHVADPHGTNVLGEIHAHVQVTIPARALTGEEETAGFLAPHGPVPAGTIRALAGSAATWDRLFRDPGTGALLATDAYKPTAAQRRFLRARDEHCRFPGCAKPFDRGDIDHTVEWSAGGRTEVTNLGSLCRHHHSLRHHSPWQVKQRAAGVYEWTSPTGRHIRERPGPSVRFIDSEQLARTRSHEHGVIETAPGDPLPPTGRSDC